MYDINSVTTNYPNGGDALSSPSAATPYDYMDSGNFMLLLLTQLRNQNPLEPVSNNEMMSQLTQINSLEELQKISSTLEELLSENQLTDAANLIGKTVEVVSWDGFVYEGVVSSVSMVDGQVMLTVDEQQYPASSIISVSDGTQGGQQGDED